MSNAKRDNAGKPKLSMLPKEPLVQIAKVLEFGEKKYDRNNWRKGLPFTGVMDSALRHIHSFLEGEDWDAESGLSHVAHAATNLVFLLQYIKDHPELDDRGDFSWKADITETNAKLAKDMAEIAGIDSNPEPFSLQDRMEAERAELRKRFEAFLIPSKPVRNIP